MDGRPHFVTLIEKYFIIMGYNSQTSQRIEHFKPFAVILFFLAHQLIYFCTATIKKTLKVRVVLGLTI